MAVNSTSSSAGTSYSSRMRVGGLSGLDVDSIVTQFMKIEFAKVDKVKQQRELLQWKSDSYREITSLLRGLKNDFFDVLKPSNNILSQSNYKKFSVASSDSSIVTATGSSTSSVGVHTITVSQVATSAVLKSAGGITKTITGSNAANYTEAQDKSFFLNVDGTKKTISLGSTLSSVADVQTAIDTAFGADKVVVSENEGNLTFTPKADSGVNKLELSATSDGGLLALGFASTDNLSNRINVSSSLETIAAKMGTPFTFDASDNISLTFNKGTEAEKTFTFHKSTSLSSMMNKINSDSSAGVILKYDEITDKITITSKQTGAGSNINISEAGSTFLQGTGLDENAEYIEGIDAKVILDGQTLTRSSNTFTVDGISYSLIKKSETPQTLTLSQDVDAVFNTIKSFIEKYNDVISTINSKISEKYDRSYQPLTDSQKEEMTEKEIEAWESKAKTGLLKNDSLLQGIVYAMRNAMIESVSGVGTSLSEIGISTTSYQDKGKLTIDETKLKEAIKNDPDSIMNLFTKSSDIAWSRSLTPEQKDERYKNEGIAYKISDILENYITTYRDSNGKKGLLLEKAGIAGDASEYNNLLYSQIDNYDTKISTLLKQLADKENRYYEQYSALESQLARMQAQSNWLASQLNGLG